MVNKIKLGLVVGGFISLMHLVWALAIAIMPATMQSFLNRIFGLHFLQPVYVITQASFGKGLLLVVFTFVVGFIIGWVLATLWNMAHKKK